MEALEDEGYVRAHIEQEQGAFDAGAYGFFGDMAPLDGGLDGALEDGLHAPPEECPAAGGLEDEDDLPIEALMDDEEDEDLSLAALLRRQMLAQQEGASSSKMDEETFGTAAREADAISTSAAAAHLQHDQPLLPPMPPQPQLLSHLGHPAAAAAAAAAGDSSSIGMHSPAAARAPAPAPAAPAIVERSALPSGMLTAGELEARMLSSANQAALQPPQAAGGQLLSMLKAGVGAAGFGQQQQQQHLQQLPRQQSPLHGTMPPGQPGLGPGVLAGMMPPASMPAEGQPPPFGPGMPPPDALAHLQQQQMQQHIRPPLPDGMPPGPYAGMLPPGAPYGPRPPLHMLQPPHLLQGGPMAGVQGPMGPPPAGHPMHGPGGLPLMPPHPGMLPPDMAGMPLPPTGQMPPPWAQGLPPPAGMPPRGPPLPGQLVPPRGMPPPGFPAAPPQQQLPPGYKAPLPGLEQQHGMPGVPGAQPQPPLAPQQQLQPGAGGLLGPLPPRQQGAAGAWARSAGPQQPGALVPRHPSPGGPGFGHNYDPAAAAVIAGPAGDQNVAALVHRLRTYGSEMMAADEINFILRIQHQATHGGQPYLEDFYYQAYLNKYYGGRNALIFAPLELRGLYCEDYEGVEPRFADLSGLGKIVLSNIRTPKMLMDVGSLHSSSKGADAAAAAAAAGPATAEVKTRPLQQEPMLAARIMIEDCMLLLSDVEDIDRMFTAAGAAASAGMQAPPGAPGPLAATDAQKLLQRMSALLGGIAASFRLPDQPVLPAADAAAAAAATSGDGVFICLMRLPKGRSLVAKTLRLLFSPPPSAASKGSKGGAAAAAAAPAPASANGGGADASKNNSSSKSVGLDVIWALLRNAELTFGPAVAAAPGGEAERRMTGATVALSAAAAEMIKRLAKPEEAVACLAACNAGLEAVAATAAAAGAAQLLPLFPAGRMPSDASPDWLVTVLASLLLRASELGLGSFAAAGNVRSLGEGYDKEAQELAEQEAQEAAGGASAATAEEWQKLLSRFTELVMLHLWGLVQAGKNGSLVAVPGASAVDVKAFVQKLASVPLMRVLMAHCDTEQQEQLRSYLSEVSH